ncbi:hypothetical protein G6F59_017898 [Rhizopus arrhizus]|uniref:Alanine racemase N-terminal domain-containing protein n=1 Tax=Rhizopus delemar TaxID=936053 RepID=A0A9P7C196_9FUNG|nr:hypothetical protein G6F59_017898 [Rhizopus arrhizus]KAG1531425.1 hypothetical protein G6F50_016702 [Rhizopus delemar]
MALGLNRFGENKTQEIRQKAAALAGQGLEWVLIGHLQTNKSKDAARDATEVQPDAGRAGAGENLDRTQQIRHGRRRRACLPAPHRHRIPHPEGEGIDDAGGELSRP